MARILLVNDQEMNGDMLSRCLKKRGYEVSIAVDGAEGVDDARSEFPGLILMDDWERGDVTPLKRLLISPGAAFITG